MKAARREGRCRCLEDSWSDTESLVKSAALKEFLIPWVIEGRDKHDQEVTD